MGRVQLNIGLQQQMISQPRNKFIDRFRTQIVKSTVQYSQQKSERFLYSNRSGQLRSNYGQKSVAKVDVHQIIVDKLEKHIAYLQKKLKDAQLQNEKLNNYLSSCQNKMMEKDAQSQNLINQIGYLQQTIKKVTWQSEIIKSNYQNAVLQQKMQKLSSEVMEKKQAYSKIQLKHQHHKRGKFSSAFLPSSFNSAFKYQGRKPEQYQSIIQQYQATNVKESAVLPKNTINTCLINEWKLKKQQNEKLSKEAKELRGKCMKQGEQLAKCKQKIQVLVRLKEELSSSNIELLAKNNKISHQYSLLMDKLKHNEQKIIDISIAIQQRSQLSLNDILQLFTIQTHKPHLQAVSQVVSISLPKAYKLQKQMQTEQMNPQLAESTRIERLQLTIQMLAKKLQEKQNEVEQYKLSYANQVTQLANLMKKQIDHIDQIGYSREQTNAQCYQQKQENLNRKEVQGHQAYEVEHEPNEQEEEHSFKGNELGNIVADLREEAFE